MGPPILAQMNTLLSVRSMVGFTLVPTAAHSSPSNEFLNFIPTSFHFYLHSLETKQIKKTLPYRN